MDTDIHLFPLGLDHPSWCEKHQSDETVVKPAQNRRLCGVCAVRSIHLIGLTTTALETGIGPVAAIADALQETVALMYEVPLEEVGPLKMERTDWWEFLPRHVLPPVDVLADLTQEGEKV